MKVVIDSNVLAAAFATRGFCHEIFEICLADHEIFLCEEILEEVKDTLTHKVKAGSKVVQEIYGLLLSHAKIVEAQKVDPSMCRDQNDLVIIGTALSAQAEIILTGDKDLLTLQKFGGTKIINPRSFWDIYRT